MKRRGLSSQPALTVAPLAGAWIETSAQFEQSHGLQVAPLAGAWIETALAFSMASATECRPPRGGVD